MSKLSQEDREHLRHLVKNDDALKELLRHFDVSAKPKRRGRQRDVDQYVAQRRLIEEAKALIERMPTLTDKQALRRVVQRYWRSRDAFRAGWGGGSRTTSDKTLVSNLVNRLQRQAVEIYGKKMGAPEPRGYHERKRIERKSSRT